MSRRNEMPTVPRNIVQIAVGAAENGFSLIALADDGTLWATESTHENGHWSQVPALPHRPIHGYAERAL